MRRQACLLPGLVVLAMVAGAAVPARADNPFSGLQRMFKRWGLFSNVQLSGNNTLTFQNNSVQGSAATFEGQRWDTGNVVAQTSVHAEGSVYKEFGFQGDLSASGYGSSYSRWLLGYVGHDTAVYYGDLNIDLGSNEFASFRKTLKGWEIDQALPRNGVLRYFRSAEKGLTRNQTFAGNDTSGPFYLTYTPIIEGSEVVKVNEQIQQFGKDYKLDYETGELDFQPVDGPPTIIPSTATVSVSYQSYGYGSSPGTLSGFRLEMPFLNKRMLVGVTHISEQMAGSGSDTAGYHEDIYNGSGTTGPFDTTFRPILDNGAQVVYQGKKQTIEQALIVLVDNVQQTESVDYDVDRDLGRIIFRRAVPPTSLVMIKYYYDLASQTTTTQGGGDVLGFDMTWAVRPTLNLRYEFGKSTPQQLGAASGTAQSLSATYRGNRLRLTGQMRDISPEFSFLDSVGFYSHQKGTDWRAEYQLAEATTAYYESSRFKSDQGYSFGASGYLGGNDFNSSSPYGSPLTSGYGTTVSSAAVFPAQTTTTNNALNVTATSTNYGIRFARPRWPGIQLDVQNMDNSGADGSSSSYQTRQFRVQYVPTGAPYSLSLSWSNNDQASLAAPSTTQQTSTTTTTSTSTTSSTKQFQASVTYTPTQRLSLNWNLGTVNTSSDTAANSTSRTQQLAARWAISDKLSLNYSKSSAVSNGTSLGYTGYSGSTTTTPINTFNPGGYSALTSGVQPTQTWHTTPVTSAVVVPAQTDGSSGSGTTTDTTTPVKYEDSTTSLGLSWRPSSAFSVDLMSGSRIYNSGGTGYLADSTQTYRNLSLMWQTNPALSLQLAYGTDSQHFIDQQNADVASNMLNLGVNFRPPSSKLGLSLMYTKQTGSSPTYLNLGRVTQQLVVATGLTDLGGRVYYQVGDGSNVYLQLDASNYASGYSAFNKQTVEMGLQRNLNSNTNMSFGYRWIRNITDSSGLLPAYSDVAQQDQNYIASTVLLTVNMNFNSGLSGRRGFRGPSSSMGYGSFGAGNLTTFGGYSSGNFGSQLGFQSGINSSLGQYGGSTVGSFGTGGFGTSGYGSSSFGGGFGSSGFGGTSFGASSPTGGGVFGGGTGGSRGRWTDRGPKSPEGPGGAGGTAAGPPQAWDLAGDSVSLY